ncbi:MAG: SAM-dependent methyltransferase [Planctomycetota bacterium]
MLTCAHGAEAAVKSDLAGSGWRLAFSRPGFVTCKHDDACEPPTGVFVRTSCRSLTQIRNADGNQAIAYVLNVVLQATPRAQYDHVHVFARDRAPIGRFDFEPGPDEVTNAVAEAFMHALQNDPRLSIAITCSKSNQLAQPGQRILNVVLVEPAHWFVGSHVATRSWTTWPGGVQPIAPAEPPVSRAYYKAAEAIEMAGFHMRPGDLAVEVGSAPGGACQRLLEMGLHVIGVDPADMDPRIASHRNFRHLQARAGDLPRRYFSGAKWLLVDSNVKPQATLSTVRNLVTSRHTQFQGLLLTLKLGDYAAAENIDQWRETIQTWGPKRIEIRQLARNRCEVCVAVTMDTHP